MIEMKHISKQWKTGSREHVLEDVSLKIGEGETVGLMGSSGCGKSTLARILLCLESYDGGFIRYRGNVLNKRDRKQMRQYRREVQYISQHPESFFDPNWKLGQSLKEAAFIHRLKGLELEERMSGLMASVHLNEAVLDRYPYQVSGGEIQRAALCRAFLPDPGLLVLDEATSMLDISVQAQILHILKELQQTKKLSYLFISHDEEAVKWFSHKIVELNCGHLKEYDNMH